MQYDALGSVDLQSSSELKDDFALVLFFFFFSILPFLFFIQCDEGPCSQYHI